MKRRCDAIGFAESLLSRKKIVQFVTGRFWESGARQRARPSVEKTKSKNKKEQDNNSARTPLF